MSEARERILQRLRANSVGTAQPAPSPPTPENLTPEQRIARFSERQAAVHGEVHRLQQDRWRDWLARELPARGVQRLLAGTGEIGRQLTAAGIPGVEVLAYENPVEAWKQELFDRVDAAVTGCRGGIAESGSLILWPDGHEPRLMSLVPPIHITLLHSEKLYRTFSEAIAEEGWHTGMPTNALLISGPSKTADIEQTLAYGIHGPRQLITLILE